MYIHHQTTTRMNSSSTPVHVQDKPEGLLHGWPILWLPGTGQASAATAAQQDESWQTGRAWASTMLPSRTGRRTVLEYSSRMQDFDRRVGRAIKQRKNKGIGLLLFSLYNSISEEDPL